ncbi:MAG TPA: SGNH/GDSL hydrolase family protein [Bryobacteraceae bacterium]|nr:SGNH/GDSL hydrolase family protein [Bryobacteraceae bacterium]
MLPRSSLTALLFAVLLTPLAAETPALRWIEPSDPQFEINGLPWLKENRFELIRLPASLKESYRQPVWDLAQDPSGGRIRFTTDSTAVAIRLEYPHPASMRNMHAFGQAGVDLYANGVYVSTAVPDSDAAPGKVTEFVYYNYADKPRMEREIVLYLPLYMPVKVRGIGVDPAAHVRPAKGFAVPRPLVFYGTSITQGGCASRPGMSYQAILGRMLNLDFVNLGFSGNGRGEPALASAVASIDAAAYILDFAQNNETVESLQEAYAPFLETIRKKHPDTPVVCITPIYSSRESAPGGDARLEGMRAVIRKAAADRIAAGDRNLQLLEGTDLLGPGQGAGLVEGTHPNDLGFEWMAEGLANRVRKVLALKAER